MEDDDDDAHVGLPESIDCCMYLPDDLCCDSLLNDICPLIPDEHHSVSAGADELLLIGIKGKSTDGICMYLLAAGQNSEAGFLHAQSPAVMQGPLHAFWGQLFGHPHLLDAAQALLVYNMSCIVLIVLGPFKTMSDHYRERYCKASA